MLGLNPGTLGPQGKASKQKQASVIFARYSRLGTWKQRQVAGDGRHAGSDEARVPFGICSIILTYTAPHPTV